MKCILKFSKRLMVQGGWNKMWNTLLAERKDYKEGRELENNKKELV